MSKEIKALEEYADYQQGTIKLLKRMVNERDLLLRDILDEVNHDFAHYGRSWLSESILKRIEEIVLK